MTHFGFLSTYPPTRCGLATFTEALAGALSSSGSDESRIVRVVESRELSPVLGVVGRVPTTVNMITGDRVSMRGAIRALDGCDVAIIQHEYGIYGGPDGDEIIPLLRALSTPAIVVLHTVLLVPSRRQRMVLETVCRLAETVVVMTENARDILRSSYSIKLSKIKVIPHGVSVHGARAVKAGEAPKRVVTWGLISPSKGLEWGIRAMAQLRERTPAVEYVIAGQTHPKVLAHEGERYREALQSLIVELGVEDDVRLDDRYLDPAQLDALIATADVVLLPYASHDQATSGVLIEAVAAGIPVVATGFPHAIELLGGGAGLIAEHSDPTSMADAVSAIIGTEETARRMRDAALRDTHDSSWPAVAERYREIAGRLRVAAA
ncbi:glycosyltransferase [Microbacterium sp. CFBP9034]|uniref:glycosyltransferase n=1 Tax=Microbacterium sp. CFBP9034 TaxID=3096540 RepID=UPI002A69B57D|nr:glycosyltransferase [Microbacterium sp. CFBP9034]MDY0909385.1 glycosyltransferase [Microbacterium sp. CFBP9034]